LPVDSEGEGVGDESTGDGLKQVSGVEVNGGYPLPLSSQQGVTISSGQITSSYATRGLSQPRERKFSQPARNIGSVKRSHSQKSFGSSEEILQYPQDSKPAFSLGSSLLQSLDKLYCNTSNPGAAISKCAFPISHPRATGGQ